MAPPRFEPGAIKLEGNCGNHYTTDAGHVFEHILKYIKQRLKIYAI